MPELPQLEVWRERLEQTVLHQPIRAVEISDPDMVDGSSAPAVKRALVGACFVSAERRGKFTILRTDRTQHLILHLGMTGRLDVADDDDTPSQTRLLIRLKSPRRLAYVNERKFGFIKIARNPQAVRGLRELGPEPLGDELTPEVFRSLLASRRRTLKPLLMDQRFLAGVGNVYADEILLQSRIRPDRRACELSESEASTLYETLREVLREAIRRGADPASMPDHWLLRRRDEDEADCPRCGLPLVYTSFGKRAAIFCRKCQK